MRSKRHAQGTSLLQDLFEREPPGRFALGHIFRTAQAYPGLADGFAADDVGYWRCDLADDDRLTWTDKVYELFGFPAGSPVERERAAARYKDHSRGVLERVRTFAIKRKCGFILDAAIEPADQGNQWIRIIAFPVIKDDQVVALHGQKRAL